MTINQYGDNPFAPGQVSDTYVPDQLIAGNLKLVTESAMITGGGVYLRGQVYGLVSAQSLEAVAGANTGNGTIGALAASAGVKDGAYKLVATAANTFSVTDPEGTAMPNATVGTAYNQQGLAFTITAGATAFVANDSFTINADGDAIGTYKPSVKTASDGSQTPCAIGVDQVDTSAGPVKGGVYLMGEFNARRLVFDASWTLPLLRAALRSASIFALSTVSAADPT